MKEIITKSAIDTKKLAEKFAKNLLRDRVSNSRKKATVIGLKGELGGGKTTFIQGIAKGLGVKERITSPTFVIFKKYKIPDTKYQIQNTNFYHIDCYRLSKPKDLMDLDFKEILSQPQNIIAIEWADKVRRILPENIFWIEFQWIDDNKRRLIFTFSFFNFNL